MLSRVQIVLPISVVLTFMFVTKRISLEILYILESGHASKYLTQMTAGELFNIETIEIC